MPRPALGLTNLTAVALVATGLAGNTFAADAARGKALYETRCIDCHSTSVHQSTTRKAASFEDIRRQVTRWSGQLGTSWAAGDIDDISVYLNDLYYRLPCPPATCAFKTGAR
jgi:hypothetical protein